MGEALLRIFKDLGFAWFLGRGISQDAVPEQFLRLVVHMARKAISIAKPIAVPDPF